MKTAQLKWRTIIGLIIILIAIVFNWNWMWGILFLLWVIPDIKNGYTFFIEPINKKDHPLLFWIIVIMWLLMSVYFLMEPFIPQIHERIYKASHSSEVVLVESSLAPQFTQRIKHAPEPIKKTETIEQIEKPNDTLAYQKKLVNKFSIAGVSLVSSTFNDMVVKDLDELWEYFYQNDIGRYIPHKDDQKIYVLFSNYDNPEVSAITITIGYKVKAKEGIHKDIDQVDIPSMYFGIIQIDPPFEQNTAKTWEQIYASELDRSNTFDLEVYTYNEETLNPEKAQIWAGLEKKEK